MDPGPAQESLSGRFMHQLASPLLVRSMVVWEQPARGIEDLAGAGYPRSGSAAGGVRGRIEGGFVHGVVFPAGEGGGRKANRETRGICVSPFL